MSEHDNQVEFFLWVRANKLYNRRPEIKAAMELCYEVPNGGMFPKRQNKKGQWWSPVAVKMIAEGLTNGIPDINLDVGNKDFHALRIEMKYRKGGLSDNLMIRHRAEEYLVDLSDEQKMKRILLIKAGFRYVVCYTTAEAKKAVIDYLPFAQKHYIEV